METTSLRHGWSLKRQLIRSTSTPRAYASALEKERIPGEIPKEREPGKERKVMMMDKREMLSTNEIAADEDAAVAAAAANEL